MKVNNQVASNPIGFFDADNKMCNLPCRLTHFTRTNFNKYQEEIIVKCWYSIKFDKIKNSHITLSKNEYRPFKW